jgi:hypothetical protein
MKRSTFMIIAALVQLGFGSMFAFFPELAIGQFLRESVPETTIMIRITGIFLLSFGVINYLARQSDDSLALRAILIGSLFYLVFTIAMDIYWTLEGMFETSSWVMFTTCASSGWFPPQRRSNPASL